MHPHLDRALPARRADAAPRGDRGGPARRRPGLSFTAHKLKGALQNFTLGRPTATAAKLERSGKTGQLAGTTEALRALESEMAVLLDQLVALRRETSRSA